jgi:glycosyltransferase involved in cell wall biosynthesis
VRVVHIMEATIGGTRRHVVDVARGEARRGLDVHLAVSAEREPRFLGDLRALEAEGVRVRIVPMVREVRPERDLRHLRELASFLRELAPDVVHTHSSKAGVLGRLAAILVEAGPRVHTPHTFAFLFAAEFGPLKRRLFYELERALGSATGRIIAVSDSEARTASASGVVSPDKLRVVPNGIDPAPWLAAQPLERSTLGVPAGAPFFAVCGLMHVAKGQDVALRALAEPELHGAHLLLAGDGEERVALERLASELGVAPRAHFLGWREDVPRILAACDALVLPSRWEGMPYILLEAMAAARPVVATRVDGASEVVLDGATGFLCAIDAPRELALAMARVAALSPSEREALGHAGRERVLARYTVERMIDGLLGVYAELA